MTNSNDTKVKLYGDTCPWCDDLPSGELCATCRMERNAIAGGIIPGDTPEPEGDIFGSVPFDWMVEMSKK